MTTSPENKLKVSENLLSQVWKGQWLQRGPLFTNGGQMVRVRSPGLENRESGPDFLGAIITLEDEILNGDVELHVRSSDWRAHGHHRDPHFNGVILQVVLWDDARPAQLENGKIIPILSLYNYLNGSLDDLSVRARAQPALLFPCHGVGEQLDKDSLATILDQYGEERFYVKAASFEVGLILDEPEQVLYEGIMGALGYTKNKKPFQELARRLPIRVVESLTRESERRTVTLQALFLGAAGLLPSQCGNKSGLGNSREALNLERIWRSLNIDSALSYADWYFFRMHPRNFPTQRLLAAGCLFNIYLEKGLLHGILELLDKTNSQIEKGFAIRGLIGQGRAREIVVNVALPFAFAWAENSYKHKLKEHVLELYRNYPRLSENQITRRLREIFRKEGDGIVSSAQRQQGLIHLYKTFCQEQRCEACPINKALEENFKPASGLG